MESLANRTARAAEWRMASSVVTALLQFAIGVLLAHLLTPADFGLMALALIAFGLAQSIGDLGMGGAVVQRSTLTTRHIRVGFTCSVLLGLAMAVVIAAAAPLVAIVTGNPMVTPLLRALSAGCLLRGISVVADALLRRQLDFKRQFFVDAASLALGYGGVAVVLADIGFGPWSLVWGSLSQTAVSSLAQLAVVRHSVRPMLARRELRDLLQFGLGAAVSRSVNFAALNGDNFVVGRWMGVANLGLYERAYSLMTLPSTYVAVVMSGVLFPALAQVQEEPARLRRGYLVATQFTAMIAAPAMATIVVAAPYLVPILYGPHWTGAVVPLQILCAAGYFRALYRLGSAVAQSVGRVYSELWRQAIYACLVIGGALLALPHGLPAVAAAVSGAILFMFVATGDLALRSTGTHWLRYCRVQLGAIATAAATAVVALGARLILEGYQAPSLIITVAVLAAAAVPWSVGVLWTLGGPDFEPVRARLPGWGVRVVSTVRPFAGRR